MKREERLIKAKPVMTAVVLTAGLVMLGGVAGTVSGQGVDDLRLPDRSSFDKGEKERNPFWPVGWSPETRKAVTSDGKAAVSPTAWFTEAAFTVSSISTGGLPLAMINGRPYGEGDLISMPNGTVQVAAIRDGSVSLKLETRTLTVTLRREAPKTVQPTE